MKVIDDKEVGEIWKREKSAAPDMFGLQADILELIRKLVEERAWRLCWFNHDSANLDTYGPQLTLMRSYIPQALEQFGIDPADWKDDD